MNVRIAQEADADALADLHSGGFDVAWSSQDLTAMISKPVYDVVLAECDRDYPPLAFGVSQWAGDDIELITLVSAPDHRRKGSAQSVLKALDNLAVSRGSDRWVLDVAEDNAAAIALYKQLGFLPFASRKDYYRRENMRVDAVIMAQKVGEVSARVDISRNAAHTGTSTRKG